jgi:protein-L-isoaspartate O-methyltransferase
MPWSWNADVHDLVAGLKGEGIKDGRVLDAIAATPRELFVEESYAAKHSPIARCRFRAARPSASPTSSR